MPGRAKLFRRTGTLSVNYDKIFDEAIDRVVRKRPEASKTLQVCFLAMNKQGEVGAYALHRGFVYAVCDAQRQDDLRDSPSIYTSTQA